MFNIHIIVVGKLKEDYWKSAEAEYLKRLKQYAKIRITEIQEEPLHNDRLKIKKIEAQKIEEKISPGSFIVALHERGKTMDSEKLAKWLEKKSQDGTEVALIIGGPLGLDPKFLERAHMQLSFSEFTFPHQMIRVILLEQLYRTGTILAQKQYHY